jgi:phage shock protein A
MSSPTAIEKKSLEAHVEICAVRYGNLDSKLENLEKRMDKVEGYLIEIKECITDLRQPQQPQQQSQPVQIKQGEDANPYKVMIAIGTTIIGTLIAGIITLIVKLT